VSTKFCEVQHCRTFGNRYFKVKMEQEHYQLSRYNTDSFLLSLPFNQRKSHPRNSLLHINNIQNHTFCTLLHLTLSESEKEYGGGG